MSRTLMIGVAVVAALLGIVSGYRGGAGQWPFQKRAVPMVAVEVREPAAVRKVLYWKDPDGKADFAPAPKKTSPRARPCLARPTPSARRPSLHATRAHAPMPATKRCLPTRISTQSTWQRRTRKLPLFGPE